MSEPTLGQRLQAARKSRGWSRLALAQASGTSSPTIARAELYNSEPKLATLQAWADALEVPVSELLAAS